MKEMINRLVHDPATVRKFIVALLGAIVVAVSLGLLPAAVGDWVAVVTAFLTSLGVYGIHNARRDNRPQVGREIQRALDEYHSKGGRR